MRRVDTKGNIRKPVQAISYADDITTVIKNAKILNETVAQITKEAQIRGLQYNEKKTKISGMQQKGPE